MRSKSSSRTRPKSILDVACAGPVAPPSDASSEGGARSPHRSWCALGLLALLAVQLLHLGCGDPERSDGVSVAGVSGGATAESGTSGGVSPGSAPSGAGSGAAGTGSAAAGTGSLPSGGKLGFAEVYETVIQRRCGACHTDPVSFGGLAFFPGGAAAAYANLVGVPAGAAAANLCRDSGLLRVQPGDPEASLIYLKLTTPPCGSHMPPAAFAQPTPEQVNLVRQWIADGAAP